MALLFLDGFDKYGGANTNSTLVGNLMTAGEWTALGGTPTLTLVAPLSSTGQALQVNGSTAGIYKTLSGASYTRLIGGVRFSTALAFACGIQFLDGVTNQAGIAINIAGTIAVRNGAALSGTILGTSTATITANSTHYLEWDITFNNSGSYQLWLDGVSILSGTGDTTATTNNSATGIYLIAAGLSANFVVDDLYVFDTTGTVNNAVLLSSPRIETTLPISDNSVQFGIGASILGTSSARSAGTYTTTANLLYLRPFVPSRASTISAIAMQPSATSAAINLRPILYADSAGVPGALLTSGSTVTGVTANTIVTMPLTTPQTLTAGTQYWLGFMCDIAFTGGLQTDTGAAGRTATSTFASGAPGTAPSTTAGAASVLLWGNISLSSAANFYEVNLQPPPAANTSYVTDTNPSDEDLYNFANLSAIPATIYAVAVKAYCARSDSGARTVSMRMKSGATDDGGSATGISPATSYGWITSSWIVDPNGSIPWTGVNLNAAQSGFRIDS